MVDAEDRVIGQLPRSEVHRRGLFHRATHVLVFNGAREVFLQKRSLKKDRQPGLWDSSASGHVDAGEDYDACAVRELAEEIGLVLNGSPEKLFKLPAGPATDQEHVWVYSCQSEGPFRLNTDEIDRGGWFSEEQVTRWLAEKPEEFAGAFREIWRRRACQ